MNEQQIYNTVKDHLLTQNRQSSFALICQYRTEEGLKCAVGCLIPDELYDPVIEGIGVKELSDYYTGNKEGAKLLNQILNNIPVSREFLVELQEIHDRNKPNLWPQKLEEFARKHNLHE